MWSYYKRTFVSVQLFAGAICWMVYRATNHQLPPTAVFFISMQVGAVLGAMWANRLRKKVARSMSCLPN
jgi:hypothetical protein